VTGLSLPGARPHYGRHKRAGVWRTATGRAADGLAWLVRWPRPPLLLLLALQAAFSLRLTWSNTSFQDEALYIWAGRLELAHWLHGAAIPAFPTYFSGSPVLYPPLSAIAADLGGLAGARLLSLGFMLTATGLLWAAASRLFGPRAAFFSCGLFVTLGVTQRLGAFATFDAMSLCLLALAAWCAVRAAESRTAQGWLTAAAVALALANATKYASAIFDPVVAAMLVLVSLRLLTGRRALLRGLTLLGYTAGLLVFGYALGGQEYATGVEQTTVARGIGTNSALSVLSQSWHLTAFVVVLAGAGALAAVRWEAGRGRRLLVALLAAAALIVPLQQARIHTLTSLTKHVDFGAWFAVMAGGYLIDRLLARTPQGTARLAATGWLAAALAVPAIVGLNQASALFRTWPDSAALVETVARVLPGTSGPVLAEHPSLLEYYLPQGAQWARWSSTRSIRLLNGQSISAEVGSGISVSAYTRRVTADYFSAVILDFQSTVWADRRIVAALEANPGYRLAANVPYGRTVAQIWVRRPGLGRAPGLAARLRPVPFYRGVLTPVARPSPVLGGIVLAVELTGLATLLLTALIRCTWRRGKGINEA
jgi:hypothetical protein